MPGLLPLVCCQQGGVESLEGVWGSVSVQVGGSGGSWIAVVNEVLGYHEHEDNGHGATKREGIMVEHKGKEGVK